MQNTFPNFLLRRELQELLNDKTAEEKLILGGGSNILFTKDFDGFILKNEIPGIDVVDEDDEYVFSQSRRGCFMAFFCYFLRQ